MQEIIHDLSTGRVETREMTPEKVAELLAERAARKAEKEADAARPTPEKDLIAAAEAAKNFQELKPVIVEFMKRVFGLMPEPVPDDGVTITPQPVEEIGK